MADLAHNDREAVAWNGVGEVFTLLDELRRHDYALGVSEYLRVQDLLFALWERGVNLTERERLKQVLGPVLCSSREEQRDFARHFDAWADQYSPDTPTPPPPPPSPVENKRLTWRQWLLIIFVSLLIGSALLILNTSTNEGPLLEALAGGQKKQVVVPSPKPPISLSLNYRGVAGGILMSVAMIGLYFRLRWLRDARLFLRKHEECVGNEKTRKLALAQTKHQLFPPIHFAKLAQQLRRRVVAGPGGLDINATIRSTMQNAGFISPVYRTRTVVPEYVALVDCRDDRDIAARLHVELVLSLQNCGLFITTYAFDSDPRVCYSMDQHARPFTIWDLAARHGLDRLLLFSEGSGLFDPTTGAIADWTTVFDAWTCRALLISKSREHWGAMERDLARLFMVDEANREGLGRIAIAVSYENNALEDEEAVARPLLLRPPAPQDLIAYPQTWLSKLEPSAACVRATLLALRQHLGDNAYLWMQACSVYPVLDWNLSLRLGEKLRDRDNRSLLTPRRLADLAELPWFRHSSMPEWLRRWLVYELTPDENTRVRAVIEKLLTDDKPGKEFIAQTEEATPSIWERVSRLFQRPKSKSKDSPCDTLFLDMMAENKLDRLAFRVSKKLEERLGGAVRKGSNAWKWIEDKFINSDNREDVALLPATDRLQDRPPPFPETTYVSAVLPTSQSEQATRKRLLWASFAALFASGFAFAIRGGIIARWGTEYGLTGAELGAITGAGFYGYCFALIIGGIIADKIGYEKVVIAAFAFHVISAFVAFEPTALMHSGTVYHYLYWSMVILAAGNGTLEAVVNPLVATLFPNNRTHYLNVVHAGWPAGLAFGAGAGWILNDRMQFNWKLQIGLCLVPMLVYGLMFLGQSMPKSEASQKGLSLGEMFRDVGILGSIVGCFLLALLLKNALQVPASAAYGISAVLVGVVAFMTRFSFGAGMLFILFVAQMLVGVVELATDGRIQNITGSFLSYGQGMILFVITSMLMVSLRFTAQFIQKRFGLSPMGILFTCAILAVVGLNMVSRIETFIAAMIALSVYAVAKAFLWPTMLAVASDRFPRTGAVAISIMGSIGMMSAGLIGPPALDYAKDRFASEELKKTDPAAYEQFRAVQPSSFLFFAEAFGLDGAKLAQVQAVEQSSRTSGQKVALEASIAGDRRTLIAESAIAAMLVLIYLGILLHFKSIGGYTRVSLKAPKTSIQ